MMHPGQWSDVTRQTMKILLASLLALAAVTAVQAEKASEKNPLVTTEWLSKNLENPKVRIVEVSVEPGVYEQGHIPGAANVKWHTDLVDNPRRDIVRRNNLRPWRRSLVSRPKRKSSSTAIITTGLPLGAPGFSSSSATTT